ncbi:hypothetical protein [Brucella cytisi]|uniref:hypothetical protein n=1 Tax=Brucella cytisi TaxID=407152 RepID=UPI000A57F925
MPFARYELNGFSRKIRLSDGSEFTPTGPIACDTGQALKAAARHGIAAAVVMRCIVKDELEEGKLVEFGRQLKIQLMPFTHSNTWFLCAYVFSATGGAPREGTSCVLSASYLSHGVAE